MTKQEKIAVKSSLLPLQHQLVQDQWDDLVSDHPYVLQDDDNIEDDFISVPDIEMQRERWMIGRDKIKERSNQASSNNELYDKIESIEAMWGTGNIQLLMGCAVGQESHTGLYLRSENTFIYWDSYNAGLVTTHDEDEAAYLLHIGYSRLSDIAPKKSNQ